MSLHPFLSHTGFSTEIYKWSFILIEEKCRTKEKKNVLSERRNGRTSPAVSVSSIL